MTKKYILTLTSTNTKTGNIPQTYSGRNTCPPRCVFKNNGCYAENWGPCFTWKRVDTQGIDIHTLAERIQKKTCRGQIIRHNVAGDMCIPGTDYLDTEEIQMLCKAYKGRKAYAYTHASITPEAVECILDAQKKGFVINVSCETFDEVYNIRQYGLNAVLAIPSMDERKFIKDGIDYQLCRSEYGYTCKSCGLCAKKNRKTVICFPVHGTRKTTARKVLMMKQV